MSNSNADNNNDNNGGNNAKINVNNLVGGDLNFDGKFDPNKDYSDAGTGGADNADAGNGGDDTSKNGKAPVQVAGKADGTGGGAAGDDKGGKDGDTDKDKTKDAAGDDNTAYYFDDAGNVVDAEGKVIINKEDIKKNEQGEIILPDGVTPPGGSDDVPLIDFVKNKLVTDFALEFKDENGKPLVFEDTEEGLAALVEHAVIEGLEAERANIFEDEPRVQAYYNHLKAGGSETNFFTKTQSWKAVALPADNAMDDAANRVRKDIVLNNFLTRFGYNAASDADKPAIRARAEKFTQMTEDSGGLLAEAKTALTDLQNIEIAEEKALDAKNKQILAEREERKRQHYATIASAIKAGDLKGINIPAAEREAFLSYVSKDVTGKGETQSMLDRKKEPIELSLQLEYMRYKGFKLDDLIAAKATTLKAQTLSARRQKTAVVVAGNKSAGSDTTAVPIGDIKLSKLL